MQLFTATVIKYCANCKDHLSATPGRHSSNVNEAESSNPDDFYFRLEGVFDTDNTTEMNSTQCSESLSADETTSLLSNTNFKPSCLKINRKIIISCVFILVFLLVGSVGTVLYLRLTAASIHSVCPVLPSPANGKIQCDSKECWFSCPDKYRLMLSKTQSARNHTICFQNNSSWSDTVPYCEKVTFCGQISIPGMDDQPSCVSNSKIIPGSIDSFSIEYPNGTNCYIACSSSYTLQGAQNVSCHASSWQPSLPTCQIKECSPLNLTTFVSKSCTKGRDIHSMCSFECAQGKHLVGKSSTTCQDSLKWSDVPPTCRASCPACLTGPDCKETTSWEKLKASIENIEPWETTAVQYAGYAITCHVNKHGGVFSFHWDCTCKDILSSLYARCNNYKSPSSSCYAALSALVKEMVANKTYPEPCDAKSMTDVCKK